jgi:hypothetical protein
MAGAAAAGYMQGTTRGVSRCDDDTATELNAATAGSTHKELGELGTHTSLGECKTLHRLAGDHLRSPRETADQSARTLLRLLRIGWQGTVAERHQPPR